jgi:hypothetical protein
MKKIIIVPAIIGVFSIAFIAYKFFGISINSLKKGYYPVIYKEVNVKEYFEDFYVTSISSAFDNNWYVSYENNTAIYFYRKCIFNENRACNFNKVKKETLENILPAYKIKNSKETFYSSLSDFINKNKKEYFDLKTCKFIGGQSNWNYYFSNGNININGSINNTCENNNVVEKSVTQNYELVLSSKDFSEVSGKWSSSME